MFLNMYIYLLYFGIRVFPLLHFSLYFATPGNISETEKWTKNQFLPWSLSVLFLLEYLKKSHIGLVFNNKWTFDYHGVLLIWNFHTFWVSCGVKNRTLNISVNIYPWITTISSFEKNVIHINMMQNSGLFPP